MGNHLEIPSGLNVNSPSSLGTATPGLGPAICFNKPSWRFHTPWALNWKRWLSTYRAFQLIMYAEVDVDTPSFLSFPLMMALGSPLTYQWLISYSGKPNILPLLPGPGIALQGICISPPGSLHLAGVSSSGNTRWELSPSPSGQHLSHLSLCIPICLLIKCSSLRVGITS